MKLLISLLKKRISFFPVSMHCLAPHPIKEIKETTRTHQPLYFHAGNILQPAAPENMACSLPRKMKLLISQEVRILFQLNSFLLISLPQLFIKPLGSCLVSGWFTWVRCLRSLPCLSGKQMKLHLNSEPLQPSPAAKPMAKPVLSNAGVGNFRLGLVWNYGSQIIWNISGGGLY